MHMTKKKATGIVAVIVLIIASVLVWGSSRSASAGQKSACAPITVHWAVGAPRSSFVDFYNDEGERLSFRMISEPNEEPVVKQEVRAWSVCTNNDTRYTFRKVGDDVWRLR